MKTDQNPVTNKRWLQIISATILVYIVAYMDRANMAIAMAGGINQELGMTATIAGLAAGIFLSGICFYKSPAAMSPRSTAQRN